MLYAKPRSVAKTLKVNKDIRAPKVRLIGEDGKQLGVFSIKDAQQKAEEAGRDLVEISPQAVPPVCKIIDYGKFRYEQTKRERINRKASQQIKMKELKLKPNIDVHDLEIKIRRAKEFIEKGYKVKFTCVFRGREIVFADHGKKVLDKICDALKEVSMIESPPKMLGKMLSLTVAPAAVKEKKQKEKKSAESKN